MSNWTEQERCVAREAGHLLLSEGKLGPARSVFQGLVAIDPADSYAHLGLGIALRGLGEVDQAQEAFEATLRRDPRSWVAALHLAELRLRGPRKDAIEAAARAESLSRTDDCPESVRARASHLLVLASAGR